MSWTKTGLKPSYLLYMPDKLLLGAKWSLAPSPPTAELLSVVEPLVTGLVFYVSAAVCFCYLESLTYHYLSRILIQF